MPVYDEAGVHNHSAGYFQIVKYFILSVVDCCHVVLELWPLNRTCAVFNRVA